MPYLRLQFNAENTEIVEEEQAPGEGGLPYHSGPYMQKPAQNLTILNFIENAPGHAQLP